MTQILAAFSGQPIEAPYLLTDMAGDAIAVLDDLGIEAAHIVGASMGGMIAQTIAIEHPERFGPFEAWFFHGVAAVELVMMVAFGFAVVMSIVQRRQIENHAWWLVSTVFLIMMPALGRGLQNVYVGWHSADFPAIDIMLPIYLCQAIIVVLVLVTAWHFEKLRHPATWFAIGVNLFVLLLEPIGRSETMQTLFRAILKD